MVLVDGRTLLVGGFGADGKTRCSSMEIVDPAGGNGVHGDGRRSSIRALAMPITGGAARVG